MCRCRTIHGRKSNAGKMDGITKKTGGEYGAATGRPRRVGPFDAVASAYGLKCQNADKIALTKLDVLSRMDEIPVITAYKLNDELITEFDPLDDLDSMTPVIQTLPGWNTDISKCRKYEELLKMQENTLKLLNIF